MNLYQVAQRAEDLDRAASFYAAHFGARVLAKFDPPGLLFMEAGGVRILFEGNAPSSLMYLLVDDVRETVNKLRSSEVTIETEPHVIFVDEQGTFGNAGEEEWMAFLRDSEGNLVGLVSRHLASS